MYPFYLGIDIHLKRTYMVLMDAKYVSRLSKMIYLNFVCNPCGNNGNNGHKNTLWTESSLSVEQDVAGSL